MKKVLLSFVALVFVGCASFGTSEVKSQAKTEAVEMKKEATKEMKKEIKETKKAMVEQVAVATESEYVGNLPCGDCAGIKSKIMLDTNGHFVKFDEYEKYVKGKLLVENTFKTKGKYMILKDIVVAKADDGEVMKFKKVGDTLIWLTMDGKMPSDPKAYTFKMVK